MYWRDFISEGNETKGPTRGAPVGLNSSDPASLPQSHSWRISGALLCKSGLTQDIPPKTSYESPPQNAYILSNGWLAVERAPACNEPTMCEWAVTHRRCMGFVTMWVTDTLARVNTQCSGCLRGFLSSKSSSFSSRTSFQHPLWGNHYF